MQTNVSLAANQAAERVTKLQADYETKVNLDEFLKYEEGKQQPEAPKEAHFVINDEEEEIPIKREEE